MTIRFYQPSDLLALFTINQASTPGVGSEKTAAGLERWLTLGTCLVSLDNSGQPIGFINLIEPGTKAYESANLRWFEAYIARTGLNLIYVDRIALAPHARSQGHGERLYKAAYAQYPDRNEIGCEVNIEPPNPGSHRFHQRLGFQQVGTRSYDDGRKAVAYYTRHLSPA